MTIRKGRPPLELDRTALIYFVKSGATKKHIQDYFGIAKSTLYRYLKNSPITEDELSQIEIKFTRLGIEKYQSERVKKTNLESKIEPVVKPTIEETKHQKKERLESDKKPNCVNKELANLIADLENADDF